MTTITIDRAVVEQALDFIVATNKSSQFWLVPESNLNKTVTAFRAALAQQAEPVAWMCSNPELMAKGYSRFSSRCEGDWNIPVYTAPPQRKLVPLTEEEILKAIGWERAEMYMKLTPNFPVDEAKQETLKNARAVERAVWEKNHG